MHGEECCVATAAAPALWCVAVAAAPWCVAVLWWHCVACIVCVAWYA